MKYTLALATCLILLTLDGVFLTYGGSVALAQDATQRVNATVKLSICGNGVAEGGEECDQNDLVGKTCVSKGYTSGTLSCDTACSYDVSACTNVSTSTGSDKKEDENNDETQSSTGPPLNAFSQLLERIGIRPSTPTAEQERLLTAQLAQYDADNDGKIESAEVAVSVGAWVDQWKSFLGQLSGTQRSDILSGQKLPCDLNSDIQCDIVDLSILLSYVE